MRKLIVGLALLSAGGANAQLLSTEEQNLDAAFAYFTDPAMGAYPGMKLEMDGTQTTAAGSVAYNATYYWFYGLLNGRPVALVSAEGYENGIPTFHIVGDGVTLWAYNFPRNEYLASRYGTYEGAQPENYRPTFFRTLQSLTKGRYSHPVRFLNETYGFETRPSQFYRSWMPGVTPTDDGTKFLYQLGNPVRRWLTFDYSLVGGGQRLLQRINYFDQTNLGSSSREVAWRIEITPLNDVPEGVDFTFTPPIGSRSISGIRSVTGG